MEQRLSVVTLGVADLARSRRSYEEGLGWRRSTDHEGIVSYQLNSSVLALFPLDELEKDARVSAEGTGFGGITLAYCAQSREEVDQVLDEAERAGAEILKPGQEVFWRGYSGYLADPDGYPWEVAWNPHWTLTDSGDVRIDGGAASSQEC